MHEAQGECVSDIGLLIDASSVLAVILALISLWRRVQVQKVQAADTHTHMRAHTHSSLWTNWPTHSYMTVTMWSGWQSMESDYFTVNKLSPLSGQQTSCTDHRPLKCLVGLAEVSGNTITGKGKTVQLAPEYFFFILCTYIYFRRQVAHFIYPSSRSNPGRKPSVLGLSVPIFVSVICQEHFEEIWHKHG